MLESIQYSYSFEIETILTQFIALIDRCIVFRYSKNQKTGERIKEQEQRPKYVMGGKSRVTYFLVNKAKNITYPVVVVSLNSIKLDQERMSAKWTSVSRQIDYNNVEVYDKPSPITLSCLVSIISTKQTDLYQIFGKLATQFQPEQFYSWCVPNNGTGYIYEELRNKVQWDGNFSIDSREKLDENSEDVFKGLMNFEIQGWLFSNPKFPKRTILDIGTTIPMDIETYYSTTNEYGEYLPYVIGNEKPLSNPREWNNAHPRILLAYLQKSSQSSLTFNFRIGNNHLDEYNLKESLYLLSLHGYNLSDVNVYLVPKNAQESTLELQEVSFDNDYSKLFPLVGTTLEKEKVFYGYPLRVIDLSDNQVIFELGKIEYQGEFDIAVASALDYDTLNISKNLILKAI